MIIFLFVISLLFRGKSRPQKKSPILSTYRLKTLDIFSSLHYLRIHSITK